MGKYDDTEYVREAKKRYRATTLKTTKIKVEIPRGLHAEIIRVTQKKELTIIQMLTDALVKYNTGQPPQT